MKIWVDDIRPKPAGFDVQCRTVKETLAYISGNWDNIELVSLDHDAGDFKRYGGDYIRVLDVLEEWSKTDHSRTIHWKFQFHSGNPVGLRNMQQIAEKNHWKVVDDYEEWEANEYP